MEQNKEYYAFISYKREDEEWAKWLQNKLEHYKFPTNLNGRTDLPKNIRPTFRDVTDSTPGFLEEVIDNALRKSEWLIVICSPRSAKSPWVCKEAQTFIDQGRADHIIPFIIEGNPFSYDVNTECYPDALLNLTGSKELLAANISEGGRDFAAVKVVARMFDLKPDTLWQRYEREQRRKRWMWTGIALLVGLVGLVIAGYFIKQNRTIENQNERLREDSVVMKNHLKRIQGYSIKMSQKNDSIEKQNKTIIQQKNDINKKNEDLIIANIKLREEKSNLQIAQSKSDAMRAMSLIKDGDSYSAVKISLNALPHNLDKPERPLVFEAENALRKSIQSNNAILKHFQKVNIAVLSPDNGMIASGEKNGVVCLWNAQNGNIYKKLRLYNDVIYNRYEIYDLCFSPNGKELACCSFDSIHVWNVDTSSKYFGEKLYSCHSRNWMRSKIRYCNERRNTIAIYSSNGIMIRNLNTGNIELLIENDKFDIVEFSKDGKLFAATLKKDHDIYIGDLASGKFLTTLKGGKGEILKIGFSADTKKLIAYSRGKHIMIWDVNTGNLIKKIKDDYGGATVALNNNGTKLVSITPNNSIVVSDIGTANIMNVLSGHKDFVNSICFNSDETLILSASNDKTVRLWDISLKHPCMEIRNSRVKMYTKVEYSKNDKLLAYNEDFDLFILDNSNFLKKEKFHHSSYVYGFSFSPDGQKIATCAHDTIWIWDVKRKELIMKFTDGGLGPQKKIGGINSPKSLSFSNDGKYLFCYSSQGVIFVWDSMTGKRVSCSNPMHHYTPLIDNVDNNFIADIGDDMKLYSRNYNYLGRNNYLKIWDWKSDRISIWGEHVGYVTHACLSPDKKTIASTCSDDYSIYIWDSKSKQLIMKLGGHTADITSISYSPNGRFLVSSSKDCTTRVWDMKTGMELKCFRVDDSIVVYSTFSNSGEKIISCLDDYGFRIWEWPSLKDIIIEANSRFSK